MMTREMMLAAIDALDRDASLWNREDYCLDVTIENFDGYDENWSEIDRAYDDEEAVGAFIEMLDRECISCEGNYYTIYHFDDFDVRLGYASFDI